MYLEKRLSAPVAKLALVLESYKQNKLAEKSLVNAT